MGWQSKFQDHTTNTAFSLTLSRNMVRALELAQAYERGEDTYNISKDFGRSVPSMRCLVNRGLIEHHDYPDNWQSLSVYEQRAFDSHHKWYTLTQAGKLVYEMCVLAGLIIPVRVKKEKAA
jgi:hypothetical protein